MCRACGKSRDSVSLKFSGNDKRYEMTELAGWANFYVIAGSSAGALIGLQFVLITLIANIPVGKDGEQAGHAFATPTIVHFAVVLLLAGIMSAPWHEVAIVEALWGAVGAAGVVYAAITTRRMMQQKSYRPEAEDWLFHAVLPMAAYVFLGVSAWAARFHLRGALFAVGATSLLLMFIAIHNAWDAATYHVFVVKPKQQKRLQSEK